VKVALVSTGAFICLIVACGSANDGDTLTPITTGPGRTPTRPPSTSSSSSSGDDFDDGCPSTAPLSESDLDAEIGWKPSLPAKGSCSTADLDQLEANFSDSSLRSYLDLGKGLSTACRACVISKDTDPKWGPIVAVTSGGGDTGFVNYGACFGAIEGDACGKAIQYESFCTSIACQDCAFSQKEQAECVTSSTTDNGMCASFANQRTTACPSWALNVKSCGTILKAVQTLCGPNPTDAGAGLDGG
jgi:hypothetical protein